MQIDPEKYWLGKGKTWFLERKKRGPFHRRYIRKQENTLMNYLDGLNFQTIFEVGCGYGRITKLILDRFPQIREIKAVDLSLDQIKTAFKYVNDDRVTYTATKIQDVQTQRKYDLVLAVSVLMHIPFGDVEKAMKNMIAASRKNIINVDWYQPIQTMSLDAIAFAHDYASLYKKLGIKRLVSLPIPREPSYGMSFGIDAGLRIFRRNEDTQHLWHAIVEKSRKGS